MAFFKVIIPTYGDCPYLQSAASSVLDQTFNDLYIIIVHDNDDKHRSVLRDNESKPLYDLYLDGRYWNGGARNKAMEFNPMPSKYTLFLDHDDSMPDEHVLENLAIFAKEHDYPDAIRLPYTKKYMNDGHVVTKALNKENSIIDMANSPRVAPWTKAVKTDLLPQFPENTTFEDVVHHLKVCDICSSYARFPQPVVEWRMWDGQTSKIKDKKWDSSKWRFIADLKDLELSKFETVKARDNKLRAAIDILFKEEGWKIS